MARNVTRYRLGTLEPIHEETDQFYTVADLVEDGDVETLRQLADRGDPTAWAALMEIDEEEQD